MPGTRNPRPA